MCKKKICVVVGGAKGRGSSLVEEYAGRKYHIAFMDIDKDCGKRLKEKICHIDGELLEKVNNALLVSLELNTYM